MSQPQRKRVECWGLASLDGLISAISHETLVHSGLAKSLHHIFGNLSFTEFLEFELNRSRSFAFWIDGGHQITVNVSLGRMSVSRIRRQGITFRSGCSNNPSWKHSAMRLPIRSLVSSVHKVMRMAGENVDQLVRVILHLQEHFVNAPAAVDSRRRFVHAVV